MGKLNLRPRYKTSGFRARIDSHSQKRIEWESIIKLRTYRKSFICIDLHQHLRDSYPK
ncbi:hypothetical protein Pan181_18220 [Aeoliella mucimassa]|uniref:Uncharacterized protein n=1 Tax=Aeoliella mucimassa TaxID=2527972 RepID=A0A518ALN3_9BACT|nr:hypothetical protein Pan181_18220 [Aeoliella mucimassa]